MTAARHKAFPIHSDAGERPRYLGCLGNTGDRRLASINNDNLAQYTLTTTPEDLVTGATVTRPTTCPAAGTEIASYNNLHHLTNLSGQALIYDADGNLLSDGTRNYTCVCGIASRYGSYCRALFPDTERAGGDLMPSHPSRAAAGRRC